MTPQSRGAGILSAIAAFSSRYCKSVLIGTALVTAVLAVYAIPPPLDPSLTTYLPSHDPAMTEFLEAEQDFKAADYQLVLVEVPEGEPVIRYQSFITEYKKRLLELPGIRKAGVNLDHKLFESIQSYLLNHGLLQMDLPGLEQLSQRLEPPALKKQIQEEPPGQTHLWTKFFDPLRIYGIIQSIFPLARRTIINPSGDYFISADPSLLFFVISTEASWPEWERTQKLRNQARQVEREVWQDVLPGMQKFYGRTDFKAPRVTWMSRHMNALKTAQSLQHVLLITMVLSACGIGLVFFIFFRRLRTLLIAYVPLVYGLIWTFATARLIYGGLNGLTIIAGAILMGLGIDFSVYILNYYYRYCHAGHNWREALARTWGEKGPAVCFGALTTAAAFLFLQTSQIPIYRQLGILAGIGILQSLIAVLFITPALLSLIDNADRARELPDYPQFLIRIPVCKTKLTILLSVVVLIVFAFFIKNFRLESAYREAYFYLRQAAAETTPADARFSSAMGAAPLPIRLMVSGDTWEQALAKNDRLAMLLKRYEAKKSIAFYDSISWWLPSQELQNKRYQKIKSLSSINADLFLKNYNETIQSYKGRNRRRYREYGKRMAELLQASEPMTPETMKEAGLQNIMDLYAKEKDHSVRLNTYIYLPLGNYPAQKEALMTSLMHEDMFLQGEIQYPSEEKVISRFKQIISHELLWLGLYISLFTGLVMMLSLKSFKMALLAAAPMMIGGVAALGAYILLMRAMSVFVIPWIAVYIGLASDDAIHICTAVQQERRPLPEVLRHVGSMIVLTSVTTVIGFGSLLSGDLRIVQWSGAWICIAMFCELIASLFLLPALLTFFDRRSSLPKFAEHHSEP